MKKFVPRTDFFHKEGIDAGIKLLRSTRVLGRSRGCLSAKCTKFIGLHPMGASSHVHLCTLLPALREKSPPIPVLPAATCSNSFPFSPSPQSAPCPARYTLVYISTTLFYNIGLVVCRYSRNIKVRELYHPLNKPYGKVRTPYELFS